VRHARATDIDKLLTLRPNPSSNVTSHINWAFIGTYRALKKYGTETACKAGLELAGVILSSINRSQPEKSILRIHKQRFHKQQKVQRACALKELTNRFRYRAQEIRMTTSCPHTNSKEPRRSANGRSGSSKKTYGLSRDVAERMVDELMGSN
jgi:hypothetical protein